MSRYIPPRLVLILFLNREKAVVVMAKETSINLDLPSEPPNWFDLVADGNLKELKTFLPVTEQVTKVRVVLTKVDDSGATLLHHAAANNRTDVMQYLIERGIDIDTVDNNGNTSLHLATTRGSVEAMNLLLCKKANDSILNKQLEAPLHIAVRLNDPKLVCALVGHPHVDILQPGPDMNTSIHIAAMYDNVEAFRVLCESSQMAKVAKSSVEKHKLSCKNRDGLTPIHVAAWKGSHRVLKLIIQSFQLLDCLSEGDLESQNLEGATPLYSAVDAGHTETVKVLVKHGAVPTKGDNSRTTPLHLACARGHLEMVQCMVEQFGSDILGKRDQLYGKLPVVCCAFSCDSANLIAFLDAKGVNLDAADDDGCTSLHFAIKSGNLSGVKELLNRGANPLAKDKHGSNSAHFAVIFSREKILELLSTHRSSSQLFTDRDNDGYSPILLALKMGNGDLVLPLLSFDRFELSQRIYDIDAEKNNCLHLAAASNDWKTLRALLDIDGSIDCINRYNSKKETPLLVAAQAGEVRSIELLLSHGAQGSNCASPHYTALMRACFNGHSKCALLLYKAYHFHRDWKDKNGNTALHYAALSGDPSTLCTALDIGCEISNNAKGSSFMDVIIASANEKCALAVVNHGRWQECLDFPSQSNSMLEFIQLMPSVAKSILDQCHQCASLDKKHADYWERFDFKYMLSFKVPLSNEHSQIIDEYGSETADTLSHQNGREKEHNSMSVLSKMVEYKRLDLLVHPVASKYLSNKWNTYGLWVYLLSFIQQLAVSILLSAFISVVPNSNVEGSQGNTTRNSSNSEEIQLSSSAQALRVITLVTTFLLTLELIMLMASKTSVIKLVATSTKNVTLLVYSISTLSTCIYLLFPNPADIWIFGAFASFFSWLAVIMGIQFFNLVGIYVKMFLTVTATVFKVLIVAIFLLLAFTFPLYVLAGSLPPFASIGYSLSTLFFFMLGEIQYDLLILEDQNGNLNNASVVFFFVVLVAILMTIVMANLLIGLAVGDIEGIRGTAFLEKRKLHILYLSYLEHSPFFRMFHKQYTHIMSYPNRKPSLPKRILNYFQTIFTEELVEINSGSTCPGTVVSSDLRTQQEEIVRLGQQLEELTHLVKQLYEQQKSTKYIHSPT